MISETIRSCLEGMYSLGWLCVRPDHENKKMAGCRDQDWCKTMKLGSHRIKNSWLGGRFSHVDIEGKQQPEFEAVDRNGLTDEVDQTYMVQPGEKRSLEVWKQMFESGEITSEEMKHLQEEPWSDVGLSIFENM